MDVDLDVCKSIAIRHGLPLQFVVKEYHVFDVLGQIAGSASKNNAELIFKGGTALSKVYFGKAQRFSEDIDFDLDADIKTVMQIAKEIAKFVEGYEITEFRKVHNTVQFYCNYENKLGGKDHVRVDISSKRIITSKPPNAKGATSEFVQSTVMGVRVYEFEDLMARKMNALSDRTEGKDVYDVYVGLPLCKGMGKAIEQMLKSEERTETASQFLQKMINAVKKADYKKLRNLTNPFIPVAYRPKDWLGLKNDLILKLENLKM